SRSSRRARGRRSTAAPKPGTATRTPTTPAARRRSSAWCSPRAASGCRGNPMDLELSPEQEQIRRTAADFFARNCPIARVRELEDSELGYDPAHWRRMGELDWIGLTWPERWGGADGALLDLYPIYLELGRSLAPTPHLASAVIVGETLARAGSDAQR